MQVHKPFKTSERLHWLWPMVAKNECWRKAHKRTHSTWLPIRL